MMYNAGAETYKCDYDIKQEKFIQKKKLIEHTEKWRKRYKLGEYFQQAKMKRDQHYKEFIHFTSLILCSCWSLSQLRLGLTSLPDKTNNQPGVFEEAGEPGEPTET